MRRIFMSSKYLKSKYRNNTYDVNSEELLNCMDMGYKTEEIASELRVSVWEIEAFKDNYFN